MSARHGGTGEGRLLAILGPTNTGKTHLAIERMCGHSSGAMGFPLRLLAREVYDRVCAIKGEGAVALITGEERIEPPHARYFLCTAEAMPASFDRRGGGGLEGPPAFVALDEAQLSASEERGHIFTDRLLHARGREETMLLGAATLEPLVRALLPGIELETRPRFSTLTHAGGAKLSRLPPRSAIVAFSAEEVYRTAELLRRFRGGAAVVMGALSPQTRNRQVALFQSGEVDYIVATDAIGMGLNLDVRHVAFAGLAKFDGVRRRRLTPAEMAQIAGRAGRHHQDGSFGTMAGGGRGEANAFTDEEVHAIENHLFAPLTHLYWREAQPSFDSVATLIADLEAPPHEPRLAAAPEAIDLAVLKRLAADGDITDAATTRGLVRRLWEVCQLPDFRQQGTDMHARFCARLWRDLAHGHIGADFVAARIAELDRPAGDIDTLQGRLAAVRSWAYICQRPDWVLARDEMAARARAAEARLSDALHARLTERFVNRRTAVLLRAMGRDARLLAVELGEDGEVLVEGQPIGRLEGFAFVLDHSADGEERRLMLAAAEKHLPQLLARQAEALLTDGLSELALAGGAIIQGTRAIASLEQGRTPSRPRIVLAREVTMLEPAQRARVTQALETWLEAQLTPLAPLRALEEASADQAAGSEVRALLVALIEGGGVVARGAAGLEAIGKERRPVLRRLGISIGALDVFVPVLLKPAARRLLHELQIDPRPLEPAMAAVVSGTDALPAGYRRAGGQAIRVDMAEKLLRAAHERRVRTPGRGFPLDPALATSMGLTGENFARLLGDAGFHPNPVAELAPGMFGPPPPRPWRWQPPKGARRGSDAPSATGKRRKPGREANSVRQSPRPGSAFAGLADLLR